jgi:hypothetical protein
VNEIELGAKAFWLVVTAGALSGIVSYGVFRRASNTSKLRAARNRIVAHLLELRLFAAEPALVLRSQRDLMVANFEFLRVAAIPSLVLVVPFAIVLVAMNAFFGYAPLRIGKPAVVTLGYRCSPGIPAAQLFAPDGILVETPPVRIPVACQISWRVCPIRAVTGELRVSCNGQSIRKSISSASGLTWLSDTRAGSLGLFLLHPLELPFSGSIVKTISVTYPSATVLGQNWLVWFSVASVGGFLVWALGRRMI